MKAAYDHSPGAYAVSVQCLTCGTMTLLASTLIDLDGPAFKAYYCEEHVPYGTRLPKSCNRAGCTRDHSAVTFGGPVSLPIAMNVNGKPAAWTPEIIAKWNGVVDGRPEGRVISANYYTPRPYVDEWNRGSSTEGFVYTIGRRVYDVLVAS